MTTKIHATVDALGNPTGFHLTPGQAHDLEGADVLLKDNGAELGLVVGSFGGPVGTLIGTVGGAILGGLFGAAAVCTVGARLGEVVDDNVLDNCECLSCGYTFSRS